MSNAAEVFICISLVFKRLCVEVRFFYLRLCFPLSECCKVVSGSLCLDLYITTTRIPLCSCVHQQVFLTSLYQNEVVSDEERHEWRSNVIVFFFSFFLVVFIRCVRSYIFSLVYFLSELVDDPLRIRKNENCISLWPHSPRTGSCGLFVFGGMGL